MIPAWAKWDNFTNGRLCLFKTHQQNQILLNDYYIHWQQRSADADRVLSFNKLDHAIADISVLWTTYTNWISSWSGNVFYIVLLQKYMDHIIVCFTTINIWIKVHFNTEKPHMNALILKKTHINTSNMIKCFHTCLHIIVTHTWTSSRKGKCQYIFRLEEI